MADTKISALTSASALGGTEILAGVQSGSTVGITASQIKTFALGGVTGTLAVLGANTFTALQTITQASANAGILASTGYSLTGADATNMVDLAGTWNTSGAPIGIKLNITNTASTGARLAEFQVGGTGVFRVDPNGSLGIQIPGNASGHRAFKFDTGASDEIAFRAWSNNWAAATSMIWKYNNSGTFTIGKATNIEQTLKVATTVAIPAGGSQSCSVELTSTDNFGVFVGSGAPTVSAAKGSLYLRSDGSTTNDRAYINTDGGTTWTALTTAA